MDSTMKIGINGLGRIGRAAFKVLRNTPNLEVVGVNDLIENENLAYLWCARRAIGPRLLWLKE